MILDIILIAYLIFSAFMGFRKGLVGILVHLIGFIIAIILAFSFNASVADYFKNNTEVGASIQSTIKEGITKAITAKDNPNQEQNFYTSIVKNFTSSSNIDDISNTVADYIFKGISFFAIFLIVIAITFILQMLLNIVFELPIIGTVNKLGGIVISVILSLIKIWIVLALISFVSPVVPIQGVNNYLETSKVAAIMKNNNIVENFFSSKMSIKE